MNIIKDTKNKKIFLFLSAIFILLLIYIIKIYFLSVINYQEITELNKNLLFDTKLLKRTDIIDRNGKILATNIKTKNLYLKTELLENEKYVAKQLSKILNLDEKELCKKITNTKSKNILIKRYLTSIEEAKIKKLPIASINFEDDLLRYYLHNNLFANVIGYTDIDKNGVIGIEYYYDDYLKNIDEPLKLTLDLSIQNSLYNELYKAQQTYKSDFIIGIISEIKTGNILGAISLPDYNLNVNEDKIKSFNKITQGLYEAGSIIKIFTISNALENKIVKQDTKIDVGDPIEYLNFKIKDGRQVKKKILTVGEIFALSSNIGAVKLAETLGNEKQVNFFDKIGLLNRINTDLNQTSLPIQPRIWKKINLMTISYGYGISISPLHIIQATNAVLNDGNFISPRFSYSFNNQIKKNVLSKETSDIVKKFFLLTVDTGTAKGSEIKGLNLGGKTGTSQKLSKEGYKKGEHLASFVGAFPMKDPQYSILVMIDRPKGETTEDATGVVASKIAKNIILNVVNFLNIKPIY